MSYLSSNSHWRKSFSSQRFASVKIEICSKLCFLLTIGFKSLSSDKEIYHRLKNFINRENLWNLSFTIHVLLKLYPHWKKPFFKPKMFLFVKIEICSKLCFSSNLGLKRLSSDQEIYLRLKNFINRENLWNLSFAIHVLLKL